MTRSLRDRPRGPAADAGQRRSAFPPRCPGAAGRAADAGARPRRRPPPPAARARQGSARRVRAPRARPGRQRRRLPGGHLMTRRPVTGGFVFQAASLVVSAILVHALYVTVVWPRSEADPGRPRRAHAGRPDLRPGALDLGHPARLRAGVRDRPHALGARHHRPEGRCSLRRERRLFERDLVAARRRHAHPARGRARVRAAPPGPARAGARGRSCPARSSPRSTASGPRAASPTPPPPPTTSARARPTGWTRSCRCSATSPGPSPPSASSAPCAASATRWPRRTAPCRATSPA